MTPSAGMTAGQALTLERGIIGLCVIALLFVFQPFSLILYGVGCALVVVGGLAFNLIPFARPGVPAKAVGRAALIVLVTLLVIALIGIGSAMLYGMWLTASRGGGV